MFIYLTQLLFQQTGLATTHLLLEVVVVRFDGGAILNLRTRMLTADLVRKFDT